MHEFIQGSEIMFERKPRMKVYAFVGPSGTGKSYRAQMVASDKGINYIIDDGLLIRGNEVHAGIYTRNKDGNDSRTRRVIIQDPLAAQIAFIDLFTGLHVCSIAVA